MLKSQILEKLHKKHNNLSFEDIDDLFEIFIKKMSNSLRNGQNIEIRGFGIFSTNTQKARISRNPKTGEKINTPKKKSIHFKYAKDMFKKINNEEE